MPSLLTRLVFAVALAAALTACDAGSPASGELPGAGRFRATVTGSTTATLEGPAGMTVLSEGGATTTAIGLPDADAPERVVALAIDGTPRTGTFAVDADDPDAPVTIALTLGAGSDGIYLSEAGSVTVTSASTSRIEGRFETTAARSTDDTQRVTVAGTFTAIRSALP